MTVDAAIEAFVEFYAEDVVCYPAPGWIEGDGVCHGHEGFRRLAAVWTENIDDAALEVHEVRDLGVRVLVLAEFTGRGRASGEPRSQRFGAINSHLRSDGKVGEVRFYLTWQEARDAVGLVHQASSDADYGVIGILRVTATGRSSRRGSAVEQEQPPPAAREILP